MLKLFQLTHAQTFGCDDKSLILPNDLVIVSYNWPGMLVKLTRTGNVTRNISCGFIGNRGVQNIAECWILVT